MRKARVPLCLVALAAAFPSVALTQAPKITSLKLDDRSFPETVVEFEVRSASGAIVENLADSDVFVMEGGNRVDGVLTRASLAGGTTYVIAVDTSGSVKPILPAIKQALVEFTSKLEPRDRVAVLTFDDNVQTQVPFTGHRAKITEGIEALETKGIATVLFYGVYRALGLFEERGLPERRVLLLISDGLDEGSAYDIGDCVELASANEVKILALGVPLADNPRLPEQARAARVSAPLNLEKLAEESGGFFLRPPEKPDWSAQLETLSRAAEAQWSFAWTSSLPTDGEAHEISLGVRLADLTLSVPLTIHTKFVEPAPAVLPPVAIPEESQPTQAAGTEDEFEAATDASEPWWGDPVLLAAVIGGGLLIVLLLLIAWFVFRRRGDSEPTQSDEHEPSEAPARPPDLPAQGPLKEVGGPAERPELAAAGQVDQKEPVTPRPVKRRTVFNAPVAAYPVYKSASLEVKSGPLSGSNLTLLEGRTTLGRDDDNHIVLEDDKISLHHAEISNREGTYWLEDLDSTNGTYVGTQRLRGAHPMEDGEQVRLGNVLLIFRARP